jgi:hypothetical protein
MLFTDRGALATLEKAIGAGPGTLPKDGTRRYSSSTAAEQNPCGKISGDDVIVLYVNLLPILAIIPGYN